MDSATLFERMLVAMTEEQPVKRRLSEIRVGDRIENNGIMVRVIKVTRNPESYRFDYVRKDGSEDWSYYKDYPDWYVLRYE